MIDKVWSPKVQNLVTTAQQLETKYAECTDITEKVKLMKQITSLQDEISKLKRKELTIFDIYCM